MASLALGIGGAFLGSAFGPLGASIGWTLGSALGNALFPEKVEGPRLQDLRLHTSSYGKMIPKLWGTMRVAGNVIWIGNGGELVEHEETSGGKGGPEVTNFTYSASFAIALIDHEIVGIRRIWANGRLISDDGGSGLPVTIYRGTETQLPDPTMEADLGVGNVPGYRGVAYVVFEDYFLTEFGNAIPNLEFEVYTAAGDIPIRVSTFSTDISGSNALGGAVYSSGVITVGNYSAGGGGGIPALSYNETSYDIDGNVLTGPSGYTAIALATNNVPGCVISNSLVAFYTTGSSSGAWFYRGVFALELTAEWPYNQGVIQGNFLYTLNLEGKLLRFPCADGIPAAAPDIVTASLGTTSIAFGTSDNDMIYVRVGSSAILEYDADLVLQYTWVSPDDMPPGFSLSSSPGFNFTRYHDLFVFSYVGLGVDKLNLISIAADHTLSLYEQARTADIPDYNYESGAVVQLGGGYVIGQDGVTLLKPPLEGAPLSVIVGDIATDCGLTAEEQDVTELTDIVDGYLVDRQTSGRDMIQPLRDAYFFDGVEIDDKVVFPKRKADSLVTIPADDLAAHADGEDAPPVVATARVQEVDLPAIVTVNYVNAAADYQAGSQTSQRQVTQSQSAVSLTFQISMSDQKAKSVADTHVMLPWVERNRFTAYVSRKYAKYTPTDVVTVDNKKLRIIDVSETRNGVLKFDGVAAFAPVLIQAGLPVTNLTFTSTPGTVTPPAASVETVMYLFDLPLVDDADEPNGIYAAVSGGTGWSGAGIFKSSDGGATYTSIATTSTPSTMGTTTDVLGDWAGGNMFDESNIVTVVLRPGQTLSSATELAVLNGANECVIGDEVIQFKNAELVDTDTYELSGLLRGRLGTKWATGEHTVGDRFGLLPLLRVPAPSDELTQERLYKPVTFGATVAGSASQAFTNTGRALKPYSPVLLGGGVNGSGDVTLNWTRRTRIGGAWLPGVDVPLSESSEQYVVQIFNSDYSLCGRAEFVSTATYTYTAADQVSDFGAAQETIFFSVAQIGEWSLGKQARGSAQGSGSTNDDPIVPIAPIE